MPDFKEKAIFMWSESAILDGSPAAIADAVCAAGFQAAHLHVSRLYTWDTPARAELARALQARGIRVYGSSAVYGDAPAGEGQAAGDLVDKYQLDGFIFDAEVGWDAKPERVTNTEALCRTYKTATDKPGAWCYWAFLHSSKGIPWHPADVLQMALRYLDVAMPMAYWSSATDCSPQYAADYLAQSYAQWQPYLNGKTYVPAGRAFNGSGLPGLMTPQQVTAFDAQARELGAGGITWWDMLHGIRLPDVWQAITDTSSFGASLPPTSGGSTMWKDNPLGIVVDQTMAVDFNKLAQGGASFVVIEAGTGFSYNPSLGAQIGAAHAAGLPVILQYVPYPAIVDYTMPGVPDDLFAKFWPTIEKRQFEGLIVSAERWWTGDLPESQAQYPRDYAGEVLINNTTHELVNRFTQKLVAKDVPVMVRTNDNFVQTYCKALANWTDGFGFFLADWRYRMPNPTDGKYTQYIVYRAEPTPVASLEALRTQLPPDAAKTPFIPGNTPTLKFWEFSGMRYQLPFVTDWNAKPKAVKTVLFNGTQAACWQTLANWQGATPEPPPDDGDPPVDDGDAWEAARTAGYAWVDAIIKAAKG